MSIIPDGQRPINSEEFLALTPEQRKGVYSVLPAFDLYSHILEPGKTYTMCERMALIEKYKRAGGKPINPHEDDPMYNYQHILEAGKLYTNQEFSDLVEAYKKTNRRTIRSKIFELQQKRYKK